MKTTKNTVHIEESSDKVRILVDSGITGFKDRLHIAMRGQSGNSFAKKVGMSEAVIRDYLSGRTYPSLNRVAILAEKCEVPLEWLVTGKGSCALLDDLEPIISIPVYNENIASELGGKAVAKGFSPVTQLPFDRGWVSYRGFKQEDLIVFWAKGDAMTPTISNFDALVINTGCNQPIDGYIYLVRYGENANPKRIQVRSKSLMLLNDNQTYPPILIDKENTEDFEIIGRVVYILKDIN